MDMRVRLPGVQSVRFNGYAQQFWAKIIEKEKQNAVAGYLSDPRVRSVRSPLGQNGLFMALRPDSYRQRLAEKLQFGARKIGTQRATGPGDSLLHLFAANNSWTLNQQDPLCEAHWKFGKVSEVCSVQFRQRGLRFHESSINSKRCQNRLNVSSEIGVYFLLSRLRFSNWEVATTVFMPDFHPKKMFKFSNFSSVYFPLESRSNWKALAMSGCPKMGPSVEFPLQNRSHQNHFRVVLPLIEQILPSETEYERLQFKPFFYLSLPRKLFSVKTVPVETNELRSAESDQTNLLVHWPNWKSALNFCGDYFSSK